MPDQASPYRPDIDGLRAIAIIFVVLYHAFPHQVPGGFIGVDVFFVISGYLITQIILRDYQAGTFSFLNFYARRFRRILPALLLVLVAFWAFGWFALLGGELKHLGKHLQTGAAFSSNFQLFGEAGYFDVASEAKPLLHLWSLAVEEQYYLLYPFLLILCLRARQSIAWWLGGIGVLSFALSVASVHAGYSLFAFYFLPTRLWELLLGGLLAALPASGSQSRPWETSALSFLALVIMILAISRLEASDLYPGWLALLPTLAAVLCISSGASSRFNRIVLGNKVMVSLGKSSYALYLWHWPLLSFARIMQEGQVSVGLRIGLIAVSMLLAHITWRLLEKPAQQYRLPASNPARARKVLAWGSAGLAAIFLLGTATVMQRGFPARYARLEPVSEVAITSSRSCAIAHSTQRAYCTETSDAPKIAIIGDSHAKTFFAGLLSTSSDVSHALILLGDNSCPYLTDVNVDGNRNCQRSNKRIDEVIRELPSLEIVVLFVRGPRYLIPDAAFDVLYKSSPELRMHGLTADTSDLSRVELLKAGMSRTITKLEREHKKVVIFGQWPELNFDPVNCSDIRPLRLWPVEIKKPCAMPQAGVMERQAGYRALLEDLKSMHPKLTLFDPLPYFCDSVNCWAARDGRPYYLDSSHVNVKGTGILEPDFVKLLSGMLRISY